MGDEESRRLILARRARFVAAALAGVAGSTSACGKAEPCLSQIVNVPPPDTGAPTGDAGAEDADADALPQPCLTPDLDSGDQ